MRIQPSRRQPLMLLCLCAGLLSGCETFNFPGVYRIEVPQGNVFDEEMVDKLEIGMTRSQVRFIMGTPLIKDTFNQDRWDYAYQVQIGPELTEQKKMTLFFEDDKLAKIVGGPGQADEATAER